MSKSFIAGSVAGAALSVVTAASLSLLATPGGTGPDQAVATAPQVVSEVTPPAEPPKAAETTAVPGQPETEAKADPEIAQGEVPKGSEFAKPKEDGATDLPAEDAGIAADVAPAAPAVQAEPAPALADTAPAAQPTPTEEPDAPSADAAAVEPPPAAPESAADQKLALETEQAPDLPEPAGEPAPTADSAANAAPAPASEPAPEPVPQPEPAAAPAPEPEPQPAAEEQAVVIVPDTGDDDAPGPVSDPEVDAQIPLDPPPPDGGGGGGGAADGEAGEGADGEAAPDAKPALAVSPGAKFVKVTPSQKTSEPPTELASNEAPGGVKVNRPETSGGDAADSSTGLPAGEVDLQSPIRKFGAKFTNTDGKPVLALLILDRGVAEGGLDPGAIAALPFPMTVALDPTRDDAAEAAALYRKAGAEVVLMASNLPQGATPADLEVAYQAYVSAIPEAIGILGGSTSEIQRSSLVAQHVAALLKADGRGMITYDQGLNPGRRAAEKLGVPTAAIERVYGTAEDNSGTLTRELDRAAFTAGQRGRLVIAIPSTPEAVTGLVAWAAGAGASGVAIAPISAVMLGQTALLPPSAPTVPAEEPAPLPEESEPEPEGANPAPEGSDSY